MKKSILKALAISAIIAFTVSSCELLGDCKTCSKVTTVDGVETNRTVGILYCGDELAEKENSSPVTIGSTTTYWDCN
jgi:hypothetical protein